MSNAGDRMGSMKRFSKFCAWLTILLLAGWLIRVLFHIPLLPF